VNAWKIVETFQQIRPTKKKKQNKTATINCGLYNVVYGSNENFYPK
jgi:hypothetical protein